jgi:predicted transcriptional regulator
MELEKIEREIRHVRSVIEGQKTQASRMEGRKEELLKQIYAKINVSDLRDAKKELKRLEKRRDSLEEQLNELYESILKMMESIEGAERE